MGLKKGKYAYIKSGNVFIKARIYNNLSETDPKRYELLLKITRRKPPRGSKIIDESSLPPEIKLKLSELK